MTVPVQDTYTESTANGVTTVFPYGFKITAAEDLEVSVAGVIVTTGFTVSGVGDSTGGNVTFSVAPANGATVLRSLNPILKRETDVQQFGDWMAAVVNGDFDRIWLALQRLKQDISRSLKVPFSTATDQVLTENAAARANKAVIFDASGNLAVSTDDYEDQAAAAAASAADADTAKSAAQAAQAAAEAVLDNFDDRYLGAKAVAPTLDNDGNALQDGALYFDTALNLLRVYDLGTTTWISLPVTALASLTDVTLTSIAAGEILKWDGAKWINNTLSEAGIAAAHGVRADIASAATLNLDAAGVDGSYLRITGTTEVTAVTLADGQKRVAVAGGAFQLTHGASLILPGAANYTTTAGDILLFIGEPSSVVRVMIWKGDGTAVVGGAQKIAQVVSSASAAVATSTATIPADDTIPQSGEGTAWTALDCDITPTNAGSTLMVELTVSMITNSDAGWKWGLALFRDAGAGAIAAGAGRSGNANGERPTVIRVFVAAGSTSATTFKVRFGTEGTGTVTVNGSGGARLFGGVAYSTLSVTEILP